MPPENQRAIVARRSMARAAPDRPDPVAAAERRLAEALAEVTRLDLEVESLSLSLGEFGRHYEARLGAVFAELDLGERLVRRLQSLEDEAGRAARRPSHRPCTGSLAALPCRYRRAERAAVPTMSKGASMKMEFLFSGLFWGIVILFVGASIIVNAVFFKESHYLAGAAPGFQAYSLESGNDSFQMYSEFPEFFLMF